MSLQVVAHKNAAGDVSLGAFIEGAFVPFVTLSAAKVAQYVQRGHVLQERASAGDDLAKDVLGDAFQASKAKKEGS